MSNVDERNISLQGTLSTSASSSSYIPALESNLYNFGVKRPPDRMKFYVHTVNENGEPFIYNVNGLAIAGLILTINPASVSLNASKIINRTPTMSGWVEDHWGEELDTITFQGSTGAFIWNDPKEIVPTNIKAPLTDTPQQIRDVFNKLENITDMGTVAPQGTGQHSGLAVEQRRSTATYKEFRHFIQLMNGNGATFDIYGLVSGRLYIQITYDYAQYRGYFESFDITESADSPFKFTYTVTFKSEKTMYNFVR